MALYAHANNKTERDKQMMQERRQINKIFENARGSGSQFIRGGPALYRSRETAYPFSGGKVKGRDRYGRAFGFGDKKFCSHLGGSTREA